MLLEGTGKCSIEVEGESFAFDEIRELAEQEGAKPGKAFTVQLDLRTSFDEVTVEHNFTEFGELKLSQSTKASWARLIQDSPGMEVTARIWTSQNWEENFYASVRVDLPEVGEASRQINDFDWDQQSIDKYGTTDPTEEQIRRAVAEKLSKSSDPSLARVAQERLTQAVNPYRSASAPQPVEIHSASRDWSILLMPDSTPRANLFQRGYARAAYGRAMGDAKAPRIDYATVGQCKHIAHVYGADVQEIDKRGGTLLKLLWWVLLFMLGIVALIGVFTPPVGWLVTGLVAWPFVHHYVTRRKLEPPFGPQR